MKMDFSLVVCALLAMACCAETVSAMDNKSLMLQTAIKQLTQLKKLVKQTGTPYLHSPNNGIKECCSRAALECFNSQLSKSLTTSNKDLQIKLNRNLRKSSILTSLDTCTAEERAKTVCDSCGSYPMTDSQEFLDNLLSLLQKAFSQLP